MHLPQLSARFIFTALAVLAAISGLLAAWVIVRARRSTGPNAAAEDNPERKQGFLSKLKQYWARAQERLRQFGSRSEWRYQVPWILICGEEGIGKTSLVESSGLIRNDQVGRREDKLRIPGTTWTFFDRGIAIDVDAQSLPDPANENRRWDSMLGQLIGRRAERPLDGAVLAISARTLLSGTRADIQRVVEKCHQQLVSLQERCEFILPVYVVVTQCDAIKGFGTFWRAQPEKCRREILGWSNPYALDNSYVPQWMDDAFGCLGDALKRLQLQAAAAAAAKSIENPIENPDDFFLMPQRFQALKESVAATLAHLFRASAYQAAPFFRGIYFVGSIGDGRAKEVMDKLDPRSQLAFAADLFTEKVFAEQNLARPLRKALWSRETLTRRLQYAAVALGACLYLSLAAAAMQLTRQVDVGVKSVDLIRRPLRQGSGDCIDQRTVYELLSNISLLDVDITFATIPASWVDRRIEKSGLRLVANKAFKSAILPAFACELEMRARRVAKQDFAVQADDLTDDRKRLEIYFEQLLSLDRAIVNFYQLAKAATADRSSALLSSMDELAQYLYGERLPAVVRSSGAFHRNALAQVEYDARVPTPETEAQVVQSLQDLIAKARQEISGEVAAGNVLLQGLDGGPPPLLAQAMKFDRWVQNMRSEWMSATPAKNPCAAVSTMVRGKLAELQKQHRDKAARLKQRDEDSTAIPAGIPADIGYQERAVITLVDDFSTSSCYEPELLELAKVHSPPDTMVFKKTGEQWQLTPQIEAEAAGMQAIVNLDSMQRGSGQPFACRLPVGGWRAEPVQEAAALIREYRAFAEAHHLDASNAVLPLYARVLRRQLQSVLDDAMNRAQVAASVTGMQGAGDSLTASEQLLAQQSNQLQRVYPTLVEVVQQYDQLGFDNAQRIGQCVRQYSTDALQRLSLLGQASGVYAAQPADFDGISSESLFTFGAESQVKDFLDAQFQRTRVLAAYAGPFVSLLQNLDVNGPVGNSSGAAYWNNTRQEIDRVVQLKDVNAQPTVLSDFVVGQLSQLTTDNCSDLLGRYVSRRRGDDLFSERRSSLENQAHGYCDNRDRAVAADRYQRWAVRFGSDLAGRFPFAAVDASADASLQATRNFFVDYDQERATLRKKLASRSQGSNALAQFLDRMDDASQLFAGATGAADSLPALRLNVEFRALPSQSPGAENIISWRLQTDSAVATFPNGPAELEWRYGQKIALVATWADRSPVAPQADAQQADMHVAGDAVTFDADGAWALLKLIKRHAPVSSVRSDALGQGMALLEFRVPTQDRQQSDRVLPSRLYLTMKLSVVDAKTGAPVAVRWPDNFPAAAPSAW